MAKLVQLIATTITRGGGKNHDDLCRTVDQWFTVDGALVVELDVVEQERADEMIKFREELAHSPFYEPAKSMQGNLPALRALLERWENI